MRTLLVATAAGVLFGCTPEPPPLPMDSPDPELPPPAASSDWCQRIRGGPPGKRALAIDLSAAHAGIRFFGAETDPTAADQALVAALEAPAALSGGRAPRDYASRLTTACHVDAEEAPLPAARVEKVGAVAVIHPGSGPVTLPSGVSAAVIDLRDVSAAVPFSALAAAVAPAIAKPIPRASRSVRQRYGMVDEVFGVKIYTSEVETVAQEPIAPAGAAELPLALLTAPRMAPAASELAITLRLMGRAWLVGEDVLSAVAELQWTGAGAGGIAWRAADLISAADGQRWPDRVAADRRLVNPAPFYAELPSLGAVPAVPPGDTGTRSAVLGYSAPKTSYPVKLSLGSVRASLMTVHGAVRLFFPYFPVVGDRIDPRLEETLASAAAASPLDRRTARDLLRRFGEALQDGHNFVYDRGTRAAGTFPAVFEDVAGEPVVRRTSAPGVNPGDTIVAIGGVPTAAWYAAELPRTSGATDGYRWNLASRYWQQMSGPTEFELRDPAGAKRTVRVDPASSADMEKLGYAASMRTAGPLTDLGAPGLYYINLEAGVLKDIATLRTQLADARLADGLVLDMRGYPGVNLYEVAQRLIGETFSGPLFSVPIYTGPGLTELSHSKFPLMPQKDPSFTRPVVLLVGHATVSAAENFGIMLVDAKRVTVVGRTSAATNGNITGLVLPGGFSFSFTGMLVRHADESRFHGVGIVPSVPVAITAADLAAGRDPELLAAIAALPH